MNIHPDDPRWTAYVLGELNTADRAEVERELESSAEAREIVDEIRMMSMLLKDELAKESPAAMDPEQKRAVRAAAAVSAAPAKRPWVIGGFAAAAIAALLVFAVALPSLLRTPTREQEQAVAVPPPAAAPAASEPVPAAPAPPAQVAADLKDQEKALEEDKAIVPSPLVPAAPLEPALAPPPVALAAPANVVANFAKDQDEKKTAERAAQAPLAQATDSLRVQGMRTVGGILTGVVVDAGGARIPGVTVTLTAAATKSQLQTVTDETGTFRFSGLTQGLYSVAYSLAGFKTVREDVAVVDGERLNLNAKLEVASVAETVTVTSSADKNKKDAGKEGQNAQAVRQAGARNEAPKPADAASPIVEQQRQELSGGRGGALAEPRRRAAMPAPPPPPVGIRLDRPTRDFNTEAYDRIEDNSFRSAAENPLATFSIDVDTASYANVRRFLNQNQLPPMDAVRIEELINYFNYDYASPSGPHPIAVHSEIASAPWSPTHRLVRIGIKAKDVDMSRRPASNLVFLIDVSGSMMTPDKLPLLKAGLKLLVDKLSENDRVSIVVYAGNSGLVLPPTMGYRKEIILQAIDRLEAGGSTNGAAGIQLAYNTAVSNFIRGGINRVILCTDGDFNVGVTNQGDLTRLIEDKAKSGVFLSVLGFGTGNLKDSTMEKLADKGNGNYAYIDTINEARKVLVDQMSGTLMTVAKDVKIQVDFNPEQVNAYRLIGYENRVFANQDFNNDAKDAGDMGAGHTVTALFEIVPRGVDIAIPGVEPSKYQQPAGAAADAVAKRDNRSNELLTVRVRYKKSDAADSTRFDVPLVDRRAAFNNASSDFQFAAAVAEFGMVLRDSTYKGSASLDQVIDVAQRNRGSDRNGYRDEFVSLVRKARSLNRW